MRRKFDRRPVYVPNSVFTTASVETPSRMTHRRIYETVGVRYDDIERVDAITADVRQMLIEHPGAGRATLRIGSVVGSGPSCSA